jgi:AraC-like DNA-binding protein
MVRRSEGLEKVSGARTSPPVTCEVRSSVPARIPSGSLPQLEALLGFPTWFRDGTSLDPAVSPIPDEIQLADGMRMVVNMCAQGAVPQVLAAIIRAPRVLHSRGWAAGLIFAPTLGDALARIVDQFQTSNPHIRVKLEAISGQAVLQVDIDATVPKIAHAYCGMGALFQIYRHIQPYGLGSMRECVLETAADDSPALMTLKDFLPAALHFGADGYRIRFPGSWLNRPNPDSQPDLWRGLTNGTGALRIGQDLVTEAVRTEVGSALARSERPPPLAEMASRVGLSERTLVRRLTNAGSSYSRLIDGERQALAARLIIDSDVSLQQMADRLAFSDRQGLGRAFRAWFGESPGRYRRRLLGARGVA